MNFLIARLIELSYGLMNLLVGRLIELIDGLVNLLIGRLIGYRLKSQFAFRLLRPSPLLLII